MLSLASATAGGLRPRYAASIRAGIKKNAMTNAMTFCEFLQLAKQRLGCSQFAKNGWKDTTVAIVIDFDRRIDADQYIKRLG